MPRSWRSWACNSALLAGWGLLLTDNVASVLQVTGDSMSPALNPPGQTCSDFVLVDKASVKWGRRIARGEVVVLWAPDSPHQQIIKRLLAVEGDTIIEDADTADVASKQLCTIPQGRCWIEGDNVAVSGDSRRAFGPVHLGLLEGRVTHVVWPPSRMGRVASRPQPQRLLAWDERGS